MGEDITEIEGTEITEEEATQQIAEAEGQPQKRKTWLENFNVEEVHDIETIDRLTVKVGVNEYKGQHLIFLAKVTDKDFSRQFFSMPAYVWEKAIAELKNIIPRLADIEKQAMANNVAKEIARLRELGVDVSKLMELSKTVKPEQ